MVAIDSPHRHPSYGVIASIHMAIFDTFSKRQKRHKGEAADVFQYDAIPQKLRVQAATIITKALGSEHIRYLATNPAWVHLESSMAEEFGVFQLPGHGQDKTSAVCNYLANCDSLSEFLDSVEMAAKIATYYETRIHGWSGAYSPRLSSEHMIEDLNERFLENGMGYRFPDGSTELIRVDSEHLHKDVVIPALHLLADKKFEGANSEYRAAHKHYIQGEYKACLNECLKAFESTMKSICAQKKWPVKPGDTASKLIEVCIAHELFPVYMQTHFGTIKSALESSIPTVRNKMGGHGQGEKTLEIPRFYAEYLLHETATTIMFLVNAFGEL